MGGKKLIDDTATIVTHIKPEYDDAIESGYRSEEDQIRSVEFSELLNQLDTLGVRLTQLEATVTSLAAETNRTAALQLRFLNSVMSSQGTELQALSLLLADKIKPDMVTSMLSTIEITVNAIRESVNNFMAGLGGPGK